MVGGGFGLQFLATTRLQRLERAAASVACRARLRGIMFRCIGHQEVLRQASAQPHIDA